MGVDSLAEAALVPHLQDIAELYTEGLVEADCLAEAALVPHLQDIAKLYTARKSGKEDEYLPV